MQDILQSEPAQRYNAWSDFFSTNPSEQLNLYTVFHFCFYLLYGLRFPHRPAEALVWAVGWEIMQHVYYAVYDPEEQARNTLPVMAVDVASRMIGFKIGSMWAKHIKKITCK